MTYRKLISGLVGTFFVSGWVMMGILEGQLARGEDLHALWQYILIFFGIYALVHVMVAWPWYSFGVIKQAAGDADEVILNEDRKLAQRRLVAAERRLQRLRS